jgi:TM2 domain-containing membrane protein YozV
MSEQQPPSAPDPGATPQDPAQDPAPEPYALEPYAAQPYAQPAYPQSPYGPPHGDQPYGQQPYGPDSYGQQQPYAQQSYAQEPYAQQPYGYGQAPPAGYPSAALSPAAGPAVFGVDPLTGVPWSHKTKATAGLFQLLLPLVGVCGVGRLYAGQIGIGLAQLLGFFLGCMLMVALVGFLIAPAVWLWAVVDGIVLLTTGGRDQYGRLLR